MGELQACGTIKSMGLQQAPVPLWAVGKLTESMREAGLSDGKILIIASQMKAMASEVGDVIEELQRIEKEQKEKEEV